MGDRPALEEDFTPFAIVVAVACNSDAGLRLRVAGLPPQSALQTAPDSTFVQFVFLSG